MKGMNYMSFSDLLKRPLPSKEKEMFESDEEDMDMDSDDEPDTEEGCCDSGRECGSMGCEDADPVDTAQVVSDSDDDDDDDDDFDPDEMSDEELAALDAELTDDEADALIDNEDNDEVELSPEEEQEADDMMGVAATTVLIKDEMNKDEQKKFIESEEAVRAAINEGLLLESDVNDLAADLGLFTEKKNYNKKMIIRLDKEAKQKQLFALAVNVSAAAHNDPDYRKLKKVNRMRKILRAKLVRKYKAEATKRMKVYYKKLTTSKSGPLAAIGKALHR
jgi:hypothetical protein